MAMPAMFSARSKLFILEPWYVLSGISLRDLLLHFGCFHVWQFPPWAQANRRVRSIFLRI